MSTDLDLDSQAILHGLVYLDRHNQLPPEGLDYVNPVEEKHSKCRNESKTNVFQTNNTVLDSDKISDLPEKKSKISKDDPVPVREKVLKTEIPLDSTETQHAIATLKIETSAVMKELARFRACDDETTSCFYCREWAQWVYRKQVVVTGSSGGNGSGGGGNGKRKKKNNPSRHETIPSSGKDELDDREANRAMRDKLRTVNELCGSLRHLVSNVEINEKRAIDSIPSFDPDGTVSQCSSPVFGSSSDISSSDNADFLEKNKIPNNNLTGDSLIESIVENVEKWIGGYRFPLADVYEDLVFEFPTDAFPYDEHQDPLDPALLLPTLHVTKTYISLSSSDFALLGNITSELIATHTYPTCQHNKAEHPTPSELETQRVIFNSQLAKYRKEYVSNYEREMDPVWQITQLLLKSVQRIEAMRVRLFTRGCHTNMQQFIQSIREKTLPFSDFWSKSVSSMGKNNKTSQAGVEELDGYFSAHLKNISDVSSSWSKTFLESYYGVAREFVRELETILGECITMCDRRALGLKYPPPLTLQPQLEVARRTISQLQPSLSNRIDKIQSMLKTRNDMVCNEIEEARKMWSFDPNLPAGKAVSARLDRASQKDIRKKMKRIEFLQHSGVISWSMQEMEQLLTSSDVAKVAVDCLELLITEAEILERAVGQVFARKLESTTDELREQRQDIIDDFTEGLLTGREELAGIIGKLLLKEAWRILEANISLQRQHDLLGGKSKKGKSSGSKNSDNKIHNKILNSEHSTKIKLLSSGLTQSHDLINNLDGIVTPDNLSEIPINSENLLQDSNPDGRKKSRNKKKKKKSKSRSKPNSSQTESNPNENNSADEPNDDLVISDAENLDCVNDSYFMPLASNFGESDEPKLIADLQDANSNENIGAISQDSEEFSNGDLIKPEVIISDGSTNRLDDSAVSEIGVVSDSNSIQKKEHRDKSDISDIIIIPKSEDGYSIENHISSTPENHLNQQDANINSPMTEKLVQPILETSETLHRPSTPDINDVETMDHNELMQLAVRLLKQKKNVWEKILGMKVQSEKVAYEYKSISNEISQNVIQSQNRQSESLAITEAVVMMEKEAFKWKSAYEEILLKFNSGQIQSDLRSAKLDVVPGVSDRNDQIQSGIKIQRYSENSVFPNTLTSVDIIDKPLSQSENLVSDNSNQEKINVNLDSPVKSPSSTGNSSAPPELKDFDFQTPSIIQNVHARDFNISSNGTMTPTSTDQSDLVLQNPEVIALSKVRKSLSNDFVQFRDTIDQTSPKDLNSNTINSQRLESYSSILSNIISNSSQSNNIKSSTDVFDKNISQIKSVQSEAVKDLQHPQEKHVMSQQQPQQIVNYPFPVNWNPFYQNVPNMSSSMMMYPQYSQQSQIPMYQQGMSNMNRVLVNLQNDQGYSNRGQSFIGGNSNSSVEGNSVYPNAPMNIHHQFQQNGSIEPLLSMQMQMQMQMNLPPNNISADLKSNPLLNLGNASNSSNLQAGHANSRNGYSIDSDDISSTMGSNIPQSALSS
ncbi:hypothetical protein AYI68_g442 [Smittium mucronatum]|uniref:Uncharacterized protein n=1 Tax=Smittium mucronatum TaxID=133383 RepID=A0A1R0H8D9_9FUNG|nr:hypothetical protein AYI68_g442 [Smittium mucronatum]